MNQIILVLMEVQKMLIILMIFGNKVSKMSVKLSMKEDLRMKHPYRQPQT